MKIYVVMQGMYEENKVITATTNKTLAEVIAKKFASEYDPTYIEEFEDAEVFLKTCWLITFGYDGSGVKAKNVSNEVSYYHCLNKCALHSHGISVSVLADDSDTAIKIASEKLAQYLEDTVFKGNIDDLDRIETIVKKTYDKTLSFEENIDNFVKNYLSKKSKGI